MTQMNNYIGFLKTMQRALRIKDSVILSLFSGILGTLVMDLSNFILWRKRKTEALYGHIAGSINVRPFRTNQSKNFWLGQITHFITGAALAYPLKILLERTGKDQAVLKGAFYGAVTWEVLYSLGQRFQVFLTKPHLTKTHYSELFNNILYGITTAQALIAFSEPLKTTSIQNRTTTQNTTVQTTQKEVLQPIYSDTPSVQRDVLM